MKTQIFTVEYIDWDSAMDMPREHLGPVKVDAYAQLSLAKTAIAAELQRDIRECYEGDDERPEMAEHVVTVDEIVFKTDTDFGDPSLRVFSHDISNLTVYVHAVDLVTYD